MDINRYRVDFSKYSMGWFTVTVLLILLISPLEIQGSETTQQEIPKNIPPSSQAISTTPTLVSAESYYPLSFRLPDGTPAGLYIEFWKLWSEINNTPINIKLLPISEMADTLRNNQYTFSPIFSSNVRKQWADFSLPIHSVQTGLILNRQYPTNTILEDLKDTKAAVLKGSHQESYLLENYPDIVIRTYDNTKQAIQDLINNQVDLVVGELPNLKASLSRLDLAGVFPISDQVLYQKTVHAAIAKKQSAFLEQLNQGIKRIPIDQLIELEKKWLPTIKPFFQNEQHLTALTIEERLWLQNHSKFIVGIDDNLPPFEFVNEQGVFSGIAADYLSYAEQLLGMKFSMAYEQSWLSSFAELKKGIESSVDLMSAAIVTEERKQEMLFTDPYVEMSTAIIVRRDTLYVESMSSLNDKTLGLVEGDFVNFVREDYPKINIKIVNSEVEGLKRLQAGEVDAFIAPIAVANYEIHKRNMNDLIIAAFSPYDLKLTMAVRKGLEPLVSILNKTFASMTDKQQALIENTWLKAYVYKGISTIEITKWLVPIILVFLLIIILVIAKSNNRLNSLLTKNRTLARRIVAIQEEERKLLSRDLHDEIGQNLTALQYHISAAKEFKDMDKIKSMLGSIDEITAMTYRSSYELMHWLRPMVLDDYGLEHALSNHIIVKLLREANIEYHKSFNGDLNQLNEDISTNIYRIAQECITNATKHSKANNLWLTLTLSNKELHMIIRDDGIGFDPEYAANRKESGLGINGIQDRLDAMGGTMDLQSDPNGTVYNIRLAFESSNQPQML